ncbi:Calcipressin [Fistulina hepatica ATCC 64428]|uniref:Calcipressin n=1 Tax=Fistulina hepatica ATCC 64428 TaxID=1128425 RepID=A0A0D7AE98_9AGAR|nr:Calcipressin [Fistulina hepatica ATCC 64428]
MTFNVFSSSPRSPIRPAVESTNTVAITRIPKSFFQPLILDILHSHFASYGEINQWAPLPGFTRILVVYEHDEDAERARVACSTISVEGHNGEHSELRVYRADRNPLIPKSPSTEFVRYLQPPPPTRNFLISPPGSPPVGWEQIQEVPPNATPLADDLVAALRKLQLQQRHHGKEVLLDPNEEDGVGVGVFVEDCDFDDEEEMREEDWVYGQTRGTNVIWRTAMPPMAISPRSC